MPARRIDFGARSGSFRAQASSHRGEGKRDGGAWPRSGRLAEVQESPGGALRLTSLIVKVSGGLPRPSAFKGGAQAMSTEIVKDEIKAKWNGRSVDVGYAGAGQTLYEGRCLLWPSSKVVHRQIRSRKVP